MKGEGKGKGKGLRKGGVEKNVNSNVETDYVMFPTINLQSKNELWKQLSEIRMLLKVRDGR